MKSYKELGSTYRNEPCLEYPGQWFVYFPGKTGDSKETSESFPTFEAAKHKAERVLQAYEDDRIEYDARKFSICWSCSDNDPRVGQVWFTGFYCAGRFDVFGNYVRT